MIAAMAANASAPMAAAINVWIISGPIGAGKSATDAVDDAAAVTAVVGWAALVPASAIVVGVALGTVAGGNSGQRVATAAVAFGEFHTEAGAEPVAEVVAALALLPGALAGGLVT